MWVHPVRDRRRLYTAAICHIFNIVYVIWTIVSYVRCLNSMALKYLIQSQIPQIPLLIQSLYYLHVPTFELAHLAIYLSCVYAQKIQEPQFGFSVPTAWNSLPKYLHDNLFVKLQDTFVLFLVSRLLRMRSMRCLVCIGILGRNSIFSLLLSN